MKEAPNSPYNKLLHRFTFNDESSVRRNGGIPTDVVFENGKGVFNGTSSYIAYPRRIIGSSISIRMRGDFSTLTGENNLINRETGPGYLIYYKTADHSIIIRDVDGALVNTISGVNILSAKEVVITYYNNIISVYKDGVLLGSNTSIATTSFSFGSIGNGAGVDRFPKMTLDLVEIYQGTLTASEVKNLYENKWNKEVSGYGGQPGVNLVTNGTFDTDVSGWSTLRCSLTWQSGGFCRCTQNYGSSQTFAVYQQDILTIGKKYKIKFLAKSSEASQYPNVLPGHFANVNWIKRPNYTTDWQEYEFDAIANVGDTYVYLVNTNVDDGTIVDIDSFTIQELQPDLLLDFDSIQGTIKDRTGKRTLTPTDVSIKKIGQSYSAEFNGTTSKIDTGADMLGTSPKTFIGWIKPYSFGEGATSDNGCIISNGTIEIRQDESLARLRMYCNGGLRSGNFNTLKLNKWTFFAVTLLTDGTTSWYLGNLNTAPSADISGPTATQVAGTANVIIGNNNNASRTFDGNISELKVVENILSIEDITNIWSSTRKKYL